MRSVVLPGDDDVPEEDGGPGRRPAIDETVSLVSDATGNARYGSLRSLDGGGQGDVFVARDAMLNRDVILKKLKGELADKEESRQRFLREIRIGALLEHPGIAPVYDICPSPDGGWFGVYRYLPRGSLHRLILDYHAAHPAVIDEVAFRALLVHFAAACRAIDFAHSQKVFHLDVKPRNIVIGQFGETQVIDWGLAWIQGEEFRRRVEERSGTSGESDGLTPAIDVSDPRGFRGTRAYASPEQHEGRWGAIGPRSDVYGLGATLSEILAGCPPFNIKLATYREDMRAGHLHGVPKPWVPRALAAIARRAMAPDPQQRYASAAALADDVDRFLADEPVSAHADPPSLRLWRFVKRHRASTAAAAALLATSAVALGAGYVVVSKERDVARENARMARMVIEDFVESVADEKWAGIPGTAEIRLQAVAKVLEEYPSIVAGQPYDADMHFQAAALFRRCANLYRTLGFDERAESLYARSRETLEGLIKTHADDVGYPIQWGHLLLDEGEVRLRTVGPERAIAIHEEALQHADALAGRLPDHPDVRLLLARARIDTAEALLEKGVTKEARELAASSVRAFATLLSDGSYQTQLMAALARVVSARIAREAGLDAEADREAAAALAAVDRIEDPSRVDPDVAWIRTCALAEKARAASLRAQDGAVETGIWEQALAAGRALVDRSSNVAVHRRTLSEVLVDHASALVAAGRPVEAVTETEEAIALLGGERSAERAVAADGAPSLAITTRRGLARAHAARARALLAAGDASGAREAFAAAAPHFAAAIEAAPRNRRLRAEADAAAMP